MSDPRIVEALAVNENISGFCAMPDAEVYLHVNPELVHTLFRKQYKVPQVAYEAVTECINRWYETGRIELAPPNCAYNSALVVAPKKDSYGIFTGFRICLDTRPLNNALTSTDRFQLPYIRHVLENFVGCNIFGEFDLSEAYLQFPLHRESRPYTAFTWGGRQYMFAGCPFGISMLPSHFQRVMSWIFHNLTFTCPYLDNLPFGSRNWDEHLEHALEIITRLNQANLKIKPSSVKIGHSEIRCLGHLLSGNGVAISPSKLEQLLEWSQPRTGKDLQRFLGFVNFLRHHVRHFADLTAPFESLKNYTGELEWTELLQHHFDAIKQALATAPVLRFPDPKKPMCIATDASNTGVGGVLYQPDEVGGELTPYNIVDICSAKLNSAQLNYPAYKKELWAIVYCLRHFHAMVWGRTDLVILTDHKPLTYMFESTELSFALQQWLDVLLDHHFVIKYRPGILNVVPDALSRMYSDTYRDSTWGVPKVPFQVMGAPLLSDSPVTELVVNAVTRAAANTAAAAGNLKEPEQDPPVSPGGGGNAATAALPTHIIDEVNSDMKQLEVVDETEPEPEPVEVSASASEAPASASPSASASTTSSASESSTKLVDLLIELDKRGKRSPATEKEKQELIDSQHQFGHFGVTAVYKALYNKGYWWPHMRTQIQEAIANCDACARFTVVKRGYNPSSFITSSGPWEHIQLDTSVHLPESPDGHRALLVIIDVFTGFVILRAVRSTSAEIVARELWEVICLFGVPKIIQSDNGVEFVNQVMRALLRLTGVEHRLIAPYNPRADGKVERAIGTVMSIIKKLLHGADTACWPLYVPFAQLSFNNKVASLTSSTPFSLMFGRSLNELKDYTQQSVPTISLEDWHDHQEKITSLIYPAISELTHLRKTEMIKTLDKHRRILLRDAYPNGATVMLNDPQRQNKFESKYIGPYTIKRRTRAGNYVLHDGTGLELDRPVPPDQLKLLSKKPRAVDTQGKEYEVQEIFQHRGRAPHYDYFVKWKHYNERSWVPAANFVDDRIIRNYWKNRNGKSAEESVSQQ